MNTIKLKPGEVSEPLRTGSDRARVLRQRVLQTGRASVDHATDFLCALDSTLDLLRALLTRDARRLTRQHTRAGAEHARLRLSV